MCFTANMPRPWNGLKRMADPSKLRVCAIIPARLQSSRLPNKVLADIAGLPMLAHVCYRSRLAKTIDEVFVATDSVEIKKAVEAYGFSVIQTSDKHQTGTDRIAEAASKIPCDIVVNVQGDEALVNPAHIDAIVGVLLKDPEIKIAIGVTPFSKKEHHSVIKAVLKENRDVLYFSRADIPSDARTSNPPHLKACHIVPFRKEILLRYAGWGRTPLEIIEFNEYLRILEKGHSMRAVPIEHATVSVDTPEDLELVRGLIQKDPYLKQYA